MPKSITREYDKSKRVLNLSANFAVFVPGFASTDAATNGAIKANKVPAEEAKKAGIYFEDTGIYKLNSVADFEYYIGKKNTNDESIEAKEATLEIADSTIDNGTEEKYIFKNLSVSELMLFDENKYKYYVIDPFTEPTFEEPANWATTKKLWAHIDNYPAEQAPSQIEPEITPENPVVPDENQDTENQENGTVEPGGGYIYSGGITKTKYFHFVEYKKADLIEYIDNGGEVATLRLVKIKVGNEGSNSNDDAPRHLGNRIAYELLLAGYTVFYRVLDSEKTVLEQLNDADFWAPLKDKAIYRIRYLTTGGCYDYNVYKYMEDVASFDNKTTIEEADTLMKSNGRGDCIALLDVDETNLTKSYSTPKDLAEAFGGEIASMNISDGKNCAVFAPRVVYVDSKDAVYNPDGELDVKFPGSFNYLLCAAKSQENFAEWWAAAGYQRGISNKKIKYTTYNFGDILINTLAPRENNTYTERAINLILNERGNYYLWGNRTAHKLDSTGLKFSHFLNIRQLCTTLKQVIFEATRQYTFDPNSDVLWINFVNAVRPTLEKMKGDQGIAGYKISKAETDKKALLKAIIRIVPIEAVEDFDISIYLEDSVDGLTVEADESEAK